MVVGFGKGTETVLIDSTGTKSPWLQWRSKACESRVSTEGFEKNDFCRGVHMSVMRFITQEVWGSRSEVMLAFTLNIKCLFL